ncbi:MAG: hypothetical protein NVSMB31_10820 [Vulcanimicrobiaceae bacterium]
MNVRPLENTERRVLLMWSVFLCIASLFLGPLAARSAGEVHAQEEVEIRGFEMPTISQSSPQEHVALRRDPFAADMPAMDDASARSDQTGVPGSDAVVGMRVQGGSPMTVSLPPGAPTNSVVSAVITGDRPQALITDGDRTRILSDGDRLDGHKVRAITTLGVYLDDGSVRRLVETRL